MHSAQKTAGIVRALYLLGAASAGVPLINVHVARIVDGNAQATAGKIRASE